MLILFASVTLAVVGLLGYLLAIVGSNRENNKATLAGTAPNLLSAYARRVMGVYIKRPSAPEQDETEVHGFSTTGRR